jgi:hypothetical protein
MFMRYAGCGIGHAAASQADINDDGNAMNVDNDTFLTGLDQARNNETEPDLQDIHLQEELRQVTIEGEMDDVDWDEAEQLMDGHELDSDSEDEGDDASSIASSEGERDFGPEDGENVYYHDTGYGDL